MKKIFKLIIAILLILLLLTGCLGNTGNLTEGFTNKTNTFNYILTYEAGEYHLHEVLKWKDSSSDALGVTTKCCHNQFWTSYNTAILYTNLPTYLPDDVIICGR